MKKTIILVGLCLLFLSIHAAPKKIWNESPQEKKERLAWWTNDRFGLFVHWGPYSLAARHEWVKKRERMDDEYYQRYVDHFDPDLYQPGEWAKLAKAAGMKYAVLTSKHHDGFAMFDSQFSDFKITNTPYGKDALKEWVDAFRDQGLKIGFYYSLLDWHHPEYVIDIKHPQSAESKQAFDALNKNRNMAVYREYMKNQLRELLTNYGRIDLLFLDFSFPEEEFGKGRDDWGSVELIQLVRKLQPWIIINDRSDLSDYWGGWDFATPEQHKVDKWPTFKGEQIPWETCQTFSGSWGYYRDEFTWKDNKQLLVLLIESVSKGGNLLLNVGPDGRGNIDHRAENALLKMGDWMKYNARSIYGCTQAPDSFDVPENTLLTYNPTTNRLYVHLLDYPLRNITLKGMQGKVKYLQFLHDASEIKISTSKGYIAIDQESTEDKDLRLSLPVNKPAVEIPVIELFLY